MKARAPRIATWLLLRFSSGPHGEAIAGDLMEQYARQPSRSWYWRQVLSAIRADVMTTASSHKWRTAAVVLMGWIAYFAASFPATWLVRASRPLLIGWVSEFAPVWSSGSSSGMLTPAILWALHLQSTIIITIACVAVGWIVSTVSRRSAPAAVCILAITVMIVEYGMIAFFFSQGLPRSLSTAELVAPALLVISRPIGVLAGGLIATRARDDGPDLVDQSR